jgi:hypothetical protein
VDVPGEGVAIFDGIRKPGLRRALLIAFHAEGVENGTKYYSSVQRLKMSEPFVPPKPNEFDRA